MLFQYTSMTIVNILRDGTVQPALRYDKLMVRILNGNMQIGRFDAMRYLNGNEEYIVEPENALELKNELIRQINEEMPELFNRRYVTHVLCPKNIAEKIRWWSAEPSVNDMLNNNLNYQQQGL